MKLFELETVNLSSKSNIVIHRIMVDLDGVLADFDKVVRDNIGLSVSDDEMWSKIRTMEDFYLNLPLMPDAMRLWKYVKKYNPQILTAIPRKTSIPEAEQNKRDWVAKHLGDHVIVKFGPYSKNKIRWAAPTRVLIDDRVDNIRDWKSKGGHGILHKSADDTISQLKDLGL